MIPTLILFGLIFGRWWRLSFIAAGLGWPVVLLANDVMSLELGLLAAAALAVVNSGVGVLVHQAALRGLRLLRARPSPSTKCGSTAGSKA